MKLVFDIGANLGNTVKIFINVSEKVIAFEPNPKLINGLKKMFKNNNVVIDSRALSSETGKKIFNISEADSVSTFSQDWINHSRFSKTIFWDYPIEVDTTTLDNIIDEYGIPDYVKIDVEGYEYEVLSSLTKFLPETLFSFEWAEEMKEKVSLIIKHVYNLGYKSFGITEEDRVLFDNEINWMGYEDLCNEVELFEPEGKVRWGMIYFKK
jgi:FkbM family methyltransferase